MNCLDKNQLADVSSLIFVNSSAFSSRIMHQKVQSPLEDVC